MGKKSAAWVAAAVAPSQASSKTSPAAPATKGGSGGSGSSSGSGSVVEQSVRDIAAHYQKTTPQRTKLLDAFMAFLVAVGALQVAYCLLVGNFVRSPPLLLLPLSLLFLRLCVYCAATGTGMNVLTDCDVFYPYSPLTPSSADSRPPSASSCLPVSFRPPPTPRDG